MDERTKKLIAVGASIGANCEPCLEYHVAKALEMGLDKDEIMEAVDVGKAVRKGSAAAMDKRVFGLFRKEQPSSCAGQTTSCCCS